MNRFMAVRFIDDIPAGRPVYPYHLMICGGTGCHASKSMEIVHRLADAIERRQIGDKVIIIETGCNGFCAQGPVMVVYPGGIFYEYLKADHVDEILDRHILKGDPVENFMYHDPVTGRVIPRLKDIPFFSMQQTRVLRNKGLIAAERIDEYIGTGGYLGACKALFEMNSEDIVKEIKISGLRGRGGAGFPTGLKWEFASRSPGPVKYILCNADEGDPGAFMDRSVLEADPNSVLEGMIIAAKAIGSHQGYIYCRAEYPLAVKRLNIAIEQARHYGLLGKDILGSGFDFDLEIYRGAGAFVCGEETALMTSIEGKRGTPRPRPPFPAVSGLWKKPTVLNNVETLASVAQIIIHGGKWYAELGTLRSKGSKIFAVTGDVNNVGLVEVPMGTALGDIIFDIAGGIPKGKKFKAVQLGGPSGGCIPGQHLNTPVDYESLTQLGAIMGSGGMIVMNEDKCMVDVARFFMDFCADESCGKCTPCRVGTRKMLEVLTRICEGKGRSGDIETLERWADIMRNTALCGLGQTASNPVLSTLRYFRHEYESHILEKRCPAVVCAGIFDAPCKHACPVGMDIPDYIALIRENRIEDAYKVLLKTNPFPSICGRVCEHRCELKCRRSMMDEPISIKYLKRYITDHAGRPPVKSAAVTRKEKIAVIGAGPSGLTAARDLAMRGYRVTIFDQSPEAGGMLRWAIPAYRLPRDVLRREIQDIFDLGVEFKGNICIGRDLSWEEIAGRFQAVYLAIGAQRSAAADLQSIEGVRVSGAVEYLREYNLGHNPYTGRKVVVVGGGNAAIDAARCAVRLGAEDAAILYRRQKADMPAQPDEILAAEQEGVRICVMGAPLRFEETAGPLKKLICQRMTLGEFDAGARRKPVPATGDQFVMETDHVILAIGQQLDVAGDIRSTGVGISRRGLIEIMPDKKSRTAGTMIFAGGDAVRGPDTVIGAISDGHAAAVEIDSAIRERNAEPAYEPPQPEAIVIPGLPEAQTESKPRVSMPEADPAQRKTDFREVELGFTSGAALEEAGRCLRCNLKEVEAGES
ncbi:MAG: NADH-quinone oxidoreductase subunit [Thermodesulfobacteriota bacterium]|nr:NADH-quinone oxidoreductase subunit [Thermodesulfobacteriota bacterium]